MFHIGIERFFCPHGRLNLQCRCGETEMVSEFSFRPGWSRKWIARKFCLRDSRGVAFGWDNSKRKVSQRGKRLYCLSNRRLSRKIANDLIWEKDLRLTPIKRGLRHRRGTKETLQSYVAPRGCLWSAFFQTTQMKACHVTWVHLILLSQLLPKQKVDVVPKKTLMSFSWPLFKVPRLRRSRMRRLSGLKSLSNPLAPRTPKSKPLRWRPRQGHLKCSNTWQRNRTLAYEEEK